MRTLVTSFIVGGVMALGEAGSPSPPARSAFADSLFAVVITRGPAWDTLRPSGEQRGFREHSANLASLRRAGRIVMGGRFGDYGLILVRANDAGEARMLFSPDSAMAGGVFRADFHVWRTIYDGTVPGR